MSHRLPVPALAANTVGALGLAAAALLAQGEDRVADQLGWLTLGCAALLLALLGDLSVVLRGRRRLAARRAELRPSVVRKSALEHEPPAVLVRTPGQTHFHLSGCLLAADRKVQRADRSAHESAGLQPCVVCRP